MANMLVNGGTKYNKSRREKNRKKRAKHNKKTNKKKKEKKKKSVPKKEGGRSKKKNKWKPTAFLPYLQKVPLIVFGDGMKNKDHVKLSGNRVGVTGILHRALKKREARGDVIVVEIDEFNRSKVCNKCQTETLDAY